MGSKIETMSIWADARQIVMNQTFGSRKFKYSDIYLIIPMGYYLLISNISHVCFMRNVDTNFFGREIYKWYLYKKYKIVVLFCLNSSVFSRGSLCQFYS